MKWTVNNLIAVSMALFLASCTSMLPVNSYFEKAGTLQKGNTEFSGHVTRYDVSQFERTEKSNTSYGFRIGYGFSDRFDMKFRYEKQSYASNFDGRLASAQYFSIIPKLSLISNKLSLLVPVSTYFAKYKTEDTKYDENYAAISPVLIYTLTPISNKIDFSAGVKSDFIFGNEGNTFLGGFLGAGFSTNLNKWALRPEVGFSMADNKATYWNYGIGFQYILSRK